MMTSETRTFHWNNLKVSMHFQAPNPLGWNTSCQDIQGPKLNDPRGTIISEILENGSVGQTSGECTGLDEKIWPINASSISVQCTKRISVCRVHDASSFLSWQIQLPIYAPKLTQGNMQSQRKRPGVQMFCTNVHAITQKTFALQARKAYAN